MCVLHWKKKTTDEGGHGVGMTIAHARCLLLLLRLKMETFKRPSPQAMTITSGDGRFFYSIWNPKGEHKIHAMIAKQLIRASNK